MKTYGDYLARIFPGIKVQKISVNAGFTCPNRDGKLGTGGCIYCRNDSFSPGYCKSSDSVEEQLKKGKIFFGRKYPHMKYLAYFQSFTGTYDKTADELYNLYKSALEVEEVVGIIIGTRPDCLPDEIVEMLGILNQEKVVFIEIGAETSHNDTLQLINRNHTWENVVEAVNKVSYKGLHTGIHLIAGLPGENKERILETIDKTASLPIETVKIHQLQVLKDTPLLKKIEKAELDVPEFSLNDYLELCVEILKRLPDNIVVERFLSQSPPEMVVRPSWGLKNYEFMAKLAKLLDQD